MAAGWWHAARRMRRSIFTEAHEAFRLEAAAFVTSRVVPNLDAWAAAGGFTRSLFTDAGDAGLTCLDGPADVGGRGLDDFRFNQLLCEALHHGGEAGAAWALVTHSDICAPYLYALATPEQRQRWLPGVCTGRQILAIAMSEPSTGSDLAAITTTAIRRGDHYVVNGSKTFISNGVSADLVIVAVKTDPSQRHRGMSLLVVEAGMAGYSVGRALDKVGLRTQDTAELHFADVEVPVENLLGGEGEGFYLLMRNLPRERLIMAVAGLALGRAAFDRTVATLRGGGGGQALRFRVAELASALEVTETYLDQCVLAVNAGTLSAADAAAAKWWATEVGKRVTESCFQLVADPARRDLVCFANDARVQTIYGGTNEIMKGIVAGEIVGKGS